MQQSNYSKEVTNRLLEVTGLTSIKELVAYLEVNEGTFRSWLSRDSLDIKLIIAKCNSENLNYILTGKREEYQGAIQGGKKGANSTTSEKFPADDGNGCKNCQKLENDIFLMRDVIKAHNLSITSLSEENERLKAENAQLKGKSEDNNKQRNSA